MEVRTLGRTGLPVSVLGFGCGAVGGLMVRGEPAEQERTVARAIEAGITFFDTARMYGNGRSETNLGRILKNLRAPVHEEVFVASKARLFAEDLADIEGALIQQVEDSLVRLQLESLDLIQLHNRLGQDRAMEQAQQIAGNDMVQVVAAFEKLKRAGKVRFWGVTGLGETAAVHQVLSDFRPHSLQVCYNLLNPSAGQPVGLDFPYQNFRGLIPRAAKQGTGVIAIRVLAGGALTGSGARHPNAAPAAGLAPIASGGSFEEDLAAAQRFQPLVEAGHVDSLAELAIRFAISHPGVSTALVGIAELAQLEAAIRAAEKGPLPPEVLAELQPG